MQKTDLLRTIGRDPLGSKEEGAGVAGADLLDDVGGDRGGDESEAGLAKTEARARGRDSDVGDGDEAHAAAEGGPLHAGDERSGQGGGGTQHGGKGEGVPAVLLLGVGGSAAHPVEIGAGAEGAAPGGEDDDADVGVASQIVESGLERSDEVIVKGVVALGALEGKRHDGAVVSDRQRWGWLVGHDHMRKTPKEVSGMGAFKAVLTPRARAVRVSSGSRMPSSQRRAVL